MRKPGNPNVSLRTYISTNSGLCTRSLTYSITEIKCNVIVSIGAKGYKKFRVTSMKSGTITRDDNNNEQVGAFHL
jgi:hypothetical protein